MATKQPFLKPGKTNKEDRENFVKYWAAYVRTHANEDWSRQQNILIDAQLKREKFKYGVIPRDYYGNNHG